MRGPDEQTPRGLVEEVARAICAASVDGGNPDEPIAGDRSLWVMFLPEAQAALTVIRARFERPAPEMISAAVRAFYEGRRPMPDAIAAAAKVALGDGQQ